MNKINNFLYSLKNKFRGKKIFDPVLKPPTYLNRHKGRDFLVLASGKSLKEEKERIHDFIREHDPITIGSNDLAWFTDLDYHTFFNRRRFCTFASSINRKSTVLLSPYLPVSLIRKFYKGDYEVAMYVNKDNRTFDVYDGIVSSSCRSSALVNVGIAIAMGAKNIHVAGLDGFVDIYNSYEGYIVDEPLTISFEGLRKLQEEYIGLIQSYLIRNNMKPFNIMTKTSFKNYYKDKDMEDIKDLLGESKG
ncbi:MAG: hypothetical protein HQ575_02600 [Candidatus Omnitrophica bacterium]|nr:hypothetical protein [Candidatus Omnitrophota bacterium]